MFVLHFGMVHEEGCTELSTTQDWIPLSEFSEEALGGIDLRYCSECVDEAPGHQDAPDVGAERETTLTTPTTPLE